MMTNVMVKTCLNQKIIKNSNLNQAMKNSPISDSESYPKADFFRKPNFPKSLKCGFNTRHDNREVTLIEFFESRMCPNIYRMFRSEVWIEVWIEHTTW